MKSLEGRVAIVTGAARGERAALGSVFAQALAKEGASIVAADFRDTTPVVRDIEAAGGQALAVEVDVRSEASVQAMMRAAIDRFGAIDILVNNAGVGSNMDPVSLLDIRTEDWDEIFQANVRGPFFCVKAALPHMRARRQGKIINLGSSMAMSGAPHRLHYVSAKGAVHAMTRALSRELGGDGIQVNTLAFGLITSRLNEHKLEEGMPYRKAIFGQRAMPVHLHAEDVAAGLVFLASSASDHMTGQMLMLDPGSVHT